MKKTFDCGCEFDLDENGKIILDINNIPLTCQKTWDLLSSGKTKGVFQLETPLGKTWAHRLKPENIEHLAALIALLRPGTLRAMTGDPPKSMSARYCDRKNKIEKVELLHPSLGKILNSTYGVLCYQEQAMLIAKELAGFNLQQADILRKAMGHKLPEVMAKVKTEFLEGCKKTKVVNEKEAEEIFSWIRESQKYNFNLSHAISYSINAYNTAYTKAHFPLQFFCAYLRGAHWKQNPQEEIFELASDIKQFGIDILVPDFRSDKLEVHIIENGLRFGLNDIKGIGEASKWALISAKKECEIIIGKPVKEWLWEEYLFKFSNKINITSNKALISCGALDYFGKTRNSMLFELDLWNKLSPKEKLWIQESKIYNLLQAVMACLDANGCQKNRQSVLLSIISSIQNPAHTLVDTPDFTSWNEQKILGIAISCSKVDGCISQLSTNSTCKEVIDGKKGFINIAGEIIAIKEFKIKNGQSAGDKMAFITVSDGTATLDSLVCFTDTWKENKHLLTPSNTVILQIEKAYKRPGYVVKKCSQI